VPMHHEAAVAIQYTAQVVERPGDVDVRNVDMPMLVRLRRLFEARALTRRLPLPSPQQLRLTQHPPHTGRTNGHHVGVQHHKRQPPIACQRILQMKVYDRLLFPIFQPEISGNPPVVFIYTTVALAPIVELAGGHLKPPDKASGPDLGLPRPAPDEIYDLVPHIMWHPGPG